MERSRPAEGEAAGGEEGDGEGDGGGGGRTKVDPTQKAVGETMHPSERSRQAFMCWRWIGSAARAETERRRASEGELAVIRAGEPSSTHGLIRAGRTLGSPQRVSPRILRLIGHVYCDVVGFCDVEVEQKEGGELDSKPSSLSRAQSDDHLHLHASNTNRR